MQIDSVLWFFSYIGTFSFHLFLFWVAVGSQGDAVRERLWTRLRNGAQGSNPLRGTAVGAGRVSSIVEALSDFMILCAHRKKRPRTSKVRSLSTWSLCFSLNIRWVHDRNPGVVLGCSWLRNSRQTYAPVPQPVFVVFPPADQILGGFLTWS